MFSTFGSVMLSEDIATLDVHFLAEYYLYAKAFIVLKFNSCVLGTLLAIRLELCNFFLIVIDEAILTKNDFIQLLP